MKKQEALAVSALIILLVLIVDFASATDSVLVPDKTKTQQQEQIYGSQLMTQEERTEYRSRIRNAKSVEAQEQIRKEHHERMRERAKVRGVDIADDPPARVHGMGVGSGIGSGGGQQRGGRNR